MGFNKKTNKVACGRDFLNLPFHVSTSSNISYKVEVYTYNQELEKQEKYDNYDIGFSISDCNKKIELDFEVGTEDDLRNSLNKLDTIIKNCEEMKSAIITASKLVQEGREYLKTLSEEEKE